MEQSVATRAGATDLAMTLGWVSLGLGLSSLLMPRTMARLAGVQPRNAWMRAIGVRELISGAGLLLRPNKPGWLWSRVVGDAMDLSLLTVAARQMPPMPPMPRPQRTGIASAALAGMTVLDLLAAYGQTTQTNAMRRPERSTRSGAGIHQSGMVHVTKSIDVNRDAESCYHFWRDSRNFPRFMQHVEAIEPISATHSRWQVHGPLGQHQTWETELTSDLPGQQLGWRTRAGSELAHAGTVRFSPVPGRGGTRIALDFQYHAPLGKTGQRLMRALGDEPSQQASEDLRRFKQLIETGEIPTTIGQPAGRRSVLGRSLNRTLNRFVHHGAPE